MCKKIEWIQPNPLIPYRNEVYYVCVIGLFKTYEYLLKLCGLVGSGAMESALANRLMPTT